MTEIEILRKYDEAVASFAAGLAAGLLDKDMEDGFREQYELFKAGRDAIREKLEREKGCESCCTEHTDWGEGGAHDFRIHGDTLSYFDHAFGWEGVNIRFCPMCGRMLTEK